MTDPKQVPEHLTEWERQVEDEVASTDPVIERLLQTVSELRGGLKGLCDDLPDDCVCHPAFKDRGMSDPNCFYCWADESLPVARKLLEEKG